MGAAARREVDHHELLVCEKQHPSRPLLRNRSQDALRVSRAKNNIGNIFSPVKSVRIIGRFHQNRLKRSPHRPVANLDQKRIRNATHCRSERTNNARTALGVACERSRRRNDFAILPQQLRPNQGLEGGAHHVLGGASSFQLKQLPIFRNRTEIGSGSVRCHRIRIGLEDWRIGGYWRTPQSKDWIGGLEDWRIWRTPQILEDIIGIATKGELATQLQAEFRESEHL